MGIPEVPATQVGGDGMVPCSHAGALRQSTCRRRRTAKHANAARVHLPPAAVRETRKLQNLLPFPWWDEQEEVLEEDEEEEAADQKDDFPDKDPD